MDQLGSIMDQMKYKKNGDMDKRCKAYQLYKELNINLKSAVDTQPKTELTIPLEKESDIISKKSVEEGNKKSPPPEKKKNSRQKLGQYWCSGVFNYSLDQLDQEFRPEVKKFIAFEEKCPSNGNIHFQCFWDFGRRIRPAEKFKHLDICWKYCKGGFKSNAEYCSKDESKSSLVIGYVPVNWKIKEDDVYPKQKFWGDFIMRPVNHKWNRSLLWFVDEESNWGKSVLMKYLFDNYDDIVVTGGNESDMLHCVATQSENSFPRVIMCNLTYGKDKVSYNGLESLLDGIFFSGKYESGFVRFPCCQIVVFANFRPDETKMGKNRFKIIDLPLWDRIYNKLARKLAHSNN